MTVTAEELRHIDAMVTAVIDELVDHTGADRETLVRTIEARPPLVVLDAEKVICGGKMRTGCFHSQWEVDAPSTMAVTWNFPSCRALTALPHELIHYFLWQMTLYPDHRHARAVWGSPHRRVQWAAAEKICTGYFSDVETNVQEANMLLE